MPIARRVTRIVATAACAVAAAPAAAGADTGLVPGGVTPLRETVAVNVVFVGFGHDTVPWEAVRATLPASSAPIVRSRAFYGIREPLGLEYTYDYRPVYTGREWEDQFFGYLASIAAPKPITEFQTAYNDQVRNALVVSDNRYIDASRVEARLIDAAPPSVDTRRPTIYLINWYGRRDFRFHVYSKTGERDPDTGMDFGADDARKLVAWGGTTADDEETGLGRRGVHRVWFYDLSAGPEAWAGNWNVDDADLDGDAVADYRIPVGWEYGRYRPLAQLPGDLAKVIRYVGLNLLFTSSPLYPPYFTADRIPDRVDLDQNTIEGWPGVDASRQFIKTGLFMQETGELPAGFEYTTDQQDLRFAGDFRECYVKFIAGTACFARFGLPPDANLFLAAALNQRSFLEGDRDYEAGLINYAVGDPSLNPGFLGYADDNWIDGTQSGVFSFVYPDVADAYGLTTTMIHEYAHHQSMSHPHDGYDSATGVDFDPTGDYFFAWLGDESNSIMSYIDLNWDFSQFDRDNSSRHHAGGFALIANRVAADILRSRHARRAAGELAGADRALVQAQRALQAHDYGATLNWAEAAYRSVVAGAAKADVPVRVRPPSTWTVLPPPRGHGGSRMRPSTIDLGARRLARGG